MNTENVLEQIREHVGEETPCTFFFRRVDALETLVLVESAAGHTIHSNCDDGIEDGDAYVGVCQSAGWTRIDKARAEAILGFDLDNVCDSSRCGAAL